MYREFTVLEGVARDYAGEEESVEPNRFVSVEEGKRDRGKMGRRESETRGDGHWALGAGGNTIPLVHPPTYLSTYLCDNTFANTCLNLD